MRRLRTKIEGWRQFYTPCFAGNSTTATDPAFSLQSNKHGPASLPAPGRVEGSIMYGRITKYRDDLGFGVIAAENGRKYRFTKSAIMNTSDPLIGQGVDFVVEASRPAQIIMMSGSPWTAFGSLGSNGR
jgi:cold shock CspA family protein